MNATDDATIRTAITHKQLIEFSFRGKKRVGEPHDYGIRNGVRQLLVYQVAGDSSSGGLPNWRWIVLEDASQFRLLDANFPGRRDAPSGKHIPWDAVFLRVDEEPKKRP